MTAYERGTLGKSRLGISMLNSDLDWEQGHSKVGRSRGTEGVVIPVQKHRVCVLDAKNEVYLIKILMPC